MRLQLYFDSSTKMQNIGTFSLVTLNLNSATAAYICSKQFDKTRDRKKNMANFILSTRLDCNRIKKFYCSQENHHMCVASSCKTIL